MGLVLLAVAACFAFQARPAIYMAWQPLALDQTHAALSHVTQKKSAAHLMPPTCDSPEIAVCVVGQLRAASREGVQRHMRQAWNRVGASCVDIFLSLGIERVDPTNNHGALAAQSHENAYARRNSRSSFCSRQECKRLDG